MNCIDHGAICILVNNCKESTSVYCSLLLALHMPYTQCLPITLCATTTTTISAYACFS